MWIFSYNHRLGVESIRVRGVKDLGMQNDICADARGELEGGVL